VSIPPRLAGKFNEVLGSDAAEDLVNWMDEMRADHAELRHQVGSVRTDIAALATTIDKLNDKFDKLGDRFDKLSDRLGTLVDKTHSVAQRVEQLRGNFIAWNAAFWLSAVTVIAGLLQILRP
jgi:predicted nuclease with TOPRIM domain